VKHLFYSFSLAALALLGAASCSKQDQSFNATNGGMLTSGGGTGQTGTGVGGSLARFTIARGHLFVVDHSVLYSYSLSNAQAPVRRSQVNVGMDVETIYPYGDKLFIGSAQAMYIYSIADPANPGLLGQASHVRACDPVVANSELAYVTVRSGNTCGGNTNSLLVYDIRNVLQPRQVNAVPMQNPHGLGLGSGTGAQARLYVCDGAAGLKVYSLANAEQPQLVRTITGRTFYDVIPLDDMLVCSVDGGTAIYSLGSNDDVSFAAMVQN